MKPAPPKTKTAGVRAVDWLLLRQRGGAGTGEDGRHLVITLVSPGGRHHGATARNAIIRVLSQVSCGGSGQLAGQAHTGDSYPPAGWLLTPDHPYTINIIHIGTQNFQASV